MLRLLPLVLAVALTSGCVAPRVQFAPMDQVGSPEAGSQSPAEAGVAVLGHVHAEAWGIHMFSAIPGVTGGLDDQGRPDRRWFEDTIRVATVLELLCSEARRRGATHLIDVGSTWNSNWVAPTLIFWTRETQASATAIRATGEPPSGAVPVGASTHR